MTYMNAEMELVTFAAEDILATSSGNGGNVDPTENDCPTKAPELDEDEF